MNLFVYLSLLICIFSCSAFANNIFVSFPDNINKNEKYVFYSHGFIVEGENSTPVHPRWGMYDFPKIKETLSNEEHNLIAYHRAKNTNPKDFAQKLVGDAKHLIKKGVKPENITFIGFSRGGYITALVSNLLARTDVNFIILAGCGQYMKNTKELTLYGNIHSIFEMSDNLVGSCKFLIERSENVNIFNEIAINTGKEHGAFYTPEPEWIVPVNKWLK